MMWHDEEHFRRELEERKLERETLRQLMDEYERVIPRLVAETELADENEDYMDTALCRACVDNQNRYEETQKELNAVKGRHRLLEIGLKDREGIEARLKAKLSQAQKVSETEKRKFQTLKDHATSSIQTAEGKLADLRREHEEVMSKLTDSLQEAKNQFRSEIGPYNKLKIEVATFKKKYDYFKGMLEARLRGHAPLNP